MLLVALVVALYARTFLLQAFRVPSDSMAPNLVAGDHVLVNKFVFRAGGAAPARAPGLPGRGVRRNDLVVFRPPGAPHEVLVKRCVALAGDLVELTDKQLRVDATVVEEPWVVHRDPHVYPSSGFAPDELRSRDNFGPFEVPSGHLFCLGDNRDESRDSRSFGAVPVQNVVGRPLLVYWSSAPAEPVPTAGGSLSRTRLAAVGRTVLAFFRPRGQRLPSWAD